MRKELIHLCLTLKMNSKILKRKTKFMDDEVKKHDMCSKMLEYYLIQNSFSYGIKVIKRQGKDKCLYEESFYAENVGDYKKANNVIEIFARNKVTPIGANEVLEDLFKQLD